MTEDLGPAKTFFAYMEAVLASDLTPTQRLVLLVQAKHADAHDNGLSNSFPSEGTMARETGLGTKTIYRTRKALVELGWLDQTHSGRGGSSKLANSYDLYIPKELIARLDPESIRHGDALQTVTESRQTVTESQAIRHGDVTSTPSSTTRSTPATTPSNTGGFDESKEGTKEEPGDSYWVGYSKRSPEGYFKQIGPGTVEPKGNHVLVTLTRPEVESLFFTGLDYPEIRKGMLGHARDVGLRPPSGPAAQSGVLSRAERDSRYGLPPGIEPVRREPSSRRLSQEEERARAMRQLFPSHR